MAAKLALAAELAASVPQDPVAVFGFCKALRALGLLDEAEIGRRIEAITVPAGFLRCRLFDRDTGVEFAAIYRSRAAPLDAVEILLTLLASERGQSQPWTAIEAVPSTHPGVLDLEVGFGPVLH